MIALVIGVSCLVGLFGYLSNTNPPDPTWVDSTVRTIIIFLGIVKVSLLVYVEVKFIDQQIIKKLTDIIDKEV